MAEIQAKTLGQGTKPRFETFGIGKPEQRKPLLLAELPSAVDSLVRQELGAVFNPEDPREKEYDFLSSEIIRLTNNATKSEQEAILEQYRKLDAWYGGEADKLDPV